MTGDAENYLGYIKDGDEAKRDAYISKMDASKQESIKQGLEQQRREYERFPADYKDAPEKKLTQGQLALYGKIQALEKQQTQQSDTTTENSKTSPPSTKQTETSSTPATLSQNGKVWFMHQLPL
ncbi:hypothetical protein J3U21_10170 [Gilliamella sp. B2776]|nr:MULTISPECIES: hypothetical protein [unclassified Gilliamella]MCX8650618.1 hypothetical protein [Gilliamella sp. B2779]MCX8656993.1 hypothetical protein [Gilliamella sp. B2894]MCX8692517.1 hypothetical protein [Gilliamella sp. B2776]MCX8696916.1 hypothetical protein [Gilliamella sp. B2828]MCX8703620.1 hypothetical protein [Gilliamella sp. B2781]